MAVLGGRWRGWQEHRCALLSAFKVFDTCHDVLQPFSACTFVDLLVCSPCECRMPWLLLPACCSQVDVPALSQDCVAFSNVLFQL